MKNQYVKAIKLIIKREDGIIKLCFKIEPQAYEQIREMLQMYEGDILHLVRLEKSDDENAFTIVLRPAKHLFEAISNQLKAMLKVS